MKIGTTIRNMGTAATKSCMLHCVQHAEAIGLDHIWVVDHVAIPPDDAEGSNGVWIDPLAALAFFAGVTNRVGLGVSVLVLPYRPPLPTAKWLASIQALSDERLLFGIGPGWMDGEFKALGVDRRRRGKITDETIDFIRTCFDTPDDIVTANGQLFYFRPRPARPPIYVGGMTDAALARAVRCGDGWLPIGIDPDKLAPRIERFQEMAAAAGKSNADIVLIGTLPDAQGQAVEQLAKCAALGATHYIQSSSYAREREFDDVMIRLQDIKRQLG